MVKDIPSDDSPAKAAGIEPGDIIVAAVDGKPVEYVGQLQQVIGFRKPGDGRSSRSPAREGVRKTFDVKLQPLNDTPQVASEDESGDSDNAATPSGSAMSRLGISVEPVTPDGPATPAPDRHPWPDRHGCHPRPAWRSWWTILSGAGRHHPVGRSKPVHRGRPAGKALAAEKSGSIVTLRIYNPRAQRGGSSVSDWRTPTSESFSGRTRRDEGRPAKARLVVGP